MYAIQYLVPGKFAVRKIYAVRMVAAWIQSWTKLIPSDVIVYAIKIIQVNSWLMNHIWIRIIVEYFYGGNKTVEIIFFQEFSFDLSFLGEKCDIDLCFGIDCGQDVCVDGICEKTCASMPCQEPNRINLVLTVTWQEAIDFIVLAVKINLVTYVGVKLDIFRR